MTSPFGLATEHATHPHNVLVNAVAAAVMAPSTHNTQPWRFRIVGTTLEVLADPKRHLNVIDVERRQQIQSCGCALYNARIAVRAMGFDDDVTIVLDDSQTELLATLELGDRIISTDADLTQMRAIPMRRTNRRPFIPRPIGPGTMLELINAAASEGAWMVRLDPQEKGQLGRLIDQADELQYDNPAFREELGRWLIPFGSRRKDGIPFVEKEYGSALPFTVHRALRSHDLGSTFGKVEEHLVEHSPVVAVIGTYADGQADWLNAGQALQAVLLHATALGMSASFLNQVLEVPEQRGKVAELVGGAGYPHMVLRLGFSEEAVHHPAPRRELGEVLEIA